MFNRPSVEDVIFSGGDEKKASKKKPADKWWEKTQKEVVHTVWQACVTNDGLDYYYNTDTKETTWDKPEELMSAAELDSKGDWVWVPDEEECYLPGKLLIDNGKKATVQLEDGRETTVASRQLTPMSRSSLQRVVPDLVLLDDMSPPLILHNLKKRFQKELIYTNVGTILISVNPYRMLPIYTKQVTKQYLGRKMGQEMPPHVFNIAYDAFYGLREFKQNQSVIISGESGAGKTEATKQCLAYLAASAGSVGNVEKKVLQANPILEAFGNAKTLRNDNSSRFGKYMRIFFNGQNRICGSATQNYLLEKIRVVQQSGNERNFHIFYQLTKAAPADIRKECGLQAPGNYRFLKACTDVSTINDEKDFAEVQQAFKDLGFTSTETRQIYKTTAAVLEIGEVLFQGEGGSEKTTITTEDHLQQAAKLLEVAPDTLRKALCIRELRIKGQATTYVQLSTKEAGNTRDALAKFIYGKAFDWLVLRINKAMGDAPRADNEIGILDIFGFEIFEHNSFEQLCINFTNEMLQQHFNNQTFKLEEAVYKSENIQFEHIAFIDNQPMLDLITKRPSGVLPLLDEELVVPRGSDKGFLGKMHERQARNPVYKQVMKNPQHFIVKHYAGDVTYDAMGFLEKNRDTLTQDLLEMLYTSGSGYIQALFPSDAAVSTRDKKSSLSKQFQAQLGRLMTTLNKTEPHYIRCVKPNHTKSADLFVPSNVKEQLTYSGVYEAVAIRKQGFPFRLSHELFKSRYSVIFTDGRAVLPGDKLEVCKEVIDKMKLKKENVQIGRTMVLYRAEEHKQLELDRSIKVRKIEVIDNLKMLIAKDTSGFNDQDKEYYYSDMARSVTDADRFRLEDPVCKQARDLLERYVEERMDPTTKRMLNEALQSKDIQQLEEVLAICEDKGYATRLTRACRDLLDKIEEVDSALLVAKQELNVDYLQQAVGMADDIGYDGAMVQECRALGNNIKKANEQLRRVVKSLNHSHMKKCLVFCASFDYHTGQVEHVQKLYTKVLAVREALGKAMKKVEEAALEGALDTCNRLKYSCDLVEDARKLWRRVCRINEEASKALKTLEEDQVRAVVKAAKEVQLSTKTVRSFAELVAGPAEAFLKAQYDKAVANKQHERAIVIGMKRKDISVAKNKDKLHLNRYPKLKDALQWSGEKFWGDRQKRAQGMLRFQPSSLHAPLTPLAVVDPARLKMLKLKVTQTFESIQKYMDQRNSSKLDKRVCEILTESLENQELRTEAYIALMKQMTANPLPASIEQGWELLALCLVVFPPSLDFENFLEAFVRADPAMEKRYSLRGLLRRRCYEGPARMLLQRENFGSAKPEQVKNVVRRMISDGTTKFEEKKLKNPSWKDLTYKFGTHEDKDPKGKKSSREEKPEKKEKKDKKEKKEKKERAAPEPEEKKKKKKKKKEGEEKKKKSKRREKA